jgi:hypothetical protein
MNKHSGITPTRTRSKDPDIEADTVSFLEESAAGRRGVLAWMTTRQGYLFFPLLILEGVNLHVKSIISLRTGAPVKDRWMELIMLTARFMIYFGLILALAVRHGVGRPRCAACHLWPLHGRDLRAESQGHAARPG